MNRINAKDICDLFNKISKSVWENIVFNHSVRTEVAEIGLTNNIIATIKNFASLKRNSNIGIWANNGWKENLYGSDLDIFVERTKGWFEWYALQAKVLKTDGKYDFRKKKEDEHQWNKLKKLKTLTKCNPKYLFYNGVKDFVFSGRDNCDKRFKSYQFGCSIVDPEIVENLLINNTEQVKRILLNDPFPKFEDFHPKIASPWRTITCCNKSIESSLYSGYQIKDALLYYPQKITNIDVLESYLEINEQEFRSELRNNNVIRVSNEKSGRTPNFAIVITDKLSSKYPEKNILQLSEKNLEYPINKGEDNESTEKDRIRIDKRT